MGFTKIGIAKNMNDTSSKSFADFEIYLGNKVRPKTAALYVRALRLWFAWCREKNYKILNGITAQDYINYLVNDGKLNPNTVNSRAHGIMRYMRWKNIPVALDLPSIKRSEPVYLKPNEIEKVIEGCRDILEKAVILTLYDTAIRINELLGLKVGDIDKTAKLIKVTRKGGAEDLVNIDDRALHALNLWIASRGISSGNVFLSMNYNSAWKLVKNVGKRAGFEDRIHPHIFRHSRAIMMLMNKTPINIVQRHLGHKSVATTIDIYGKFMAADIKDMIPKI